MTTLEQDVLRRMGARIIARGLTTKHRGSVVALDDVSLDIEPGRLTAIIGPSGAGRRPSTGDCLRSSRS